MNSLLHATLLAAGLSIFALLGQWLVNRFANREALDAHRDAGGALLGVVATLFAVLLGFMMGSAMDSYSDAQMHDEHEANNIANAFRVAGGLSRTDGPKIRALCRQYVDTVIDKEWPEMATGGHVDRGWSAYQALWDATIAVSPENDRQTNLHAALVTAMQNVGENRRARLLLARTGMPTALWWVVGLGALSALLLSYVFASKFPRVQSVMTVLVTTAIALNIWLLSAYGHPYSGELKIEPEMFELIRKTTLQQSDAPSTQLHDAPAHATP